jgi:outer membrane protein TolC
MPLLYKVAGLFGGVVLILLCSTICNGQENSATSVRVSRESLIREAIAKNPGLRAIALRARATEMESEAEGRLPDPEAEVQIWQIPVSRPYAVNDAQMVMVGVRQPIPAPGVQSARSEAKRRDADVDRVMAGEREREIIRDLSNAYVDYQQAYELAELHRRHRESASQIAAMSRARLAAGGAIMDVANAEVEVASIEAEIAMQEEKSKVAKAKINGLLVRSNDAQLALPEPIAEVTLAENVGDLISRAQLQRPEMRIAQARQAASLSQVAVMQREANWPMMSVGALYFAPMGEMPHAYGFSFGASLPWIWGKAPAQARASRLASQSSEENVNDTRTRIASDVTSNAAMVKASERKIIACLSGCFPKPGVRQ